MVVSKSIDEAIVIGILDGRYACDGISAINACIIGSAATTECIEVIACGILDDAECSISSRSSTGERKSKIGFYGYGPALSDGRQPLVLASNDNFNPLLSCWVAVLILRRTAACID